MLKRLTWLIVIISLLFGTVAFADGGDAAFERDEIHMLQESGIIKGNLDGDLRPDDVLTRAEFATILCRAIGAEALAETDEMIGKGYFSDVPHTHWAAGYINTAVDYKAISGFEDKTFRPELAVTNEQVVKMLVAAWGYDAEAEALGGYPNGYMEIAKRYGMTDAVLFNYGIASKRWVACAFTYGALAMPVDESADIDVPVKAEPIGGTPRPENKDYVDDPVSILKRITPASAKYERKLFEQRTAIDLIPFELDGTVLLFHEEPGGRRIHVHVSQPDNKQPLAEGTFSENRFDLGNLPAGTWQGQISILDGAVNDTYFVSIKSDGNSLLTFTGNVFRYTMLNVQPIINEVFEDVTSTEIQSSTLNPFLITPQYDLAGSLGLSISYPLVLPEGSWLSLSMNTMGDLPIIYLASEHVQGKNDVEEPLSVTGLALDTEYHMELSVRNEYGDDVALKGIITLLEMDGALDYLFEGRVRTLTMDGYEIREYE